MIDKPITRTQRDVDLVLADLVDGQRTFEQNYGDAVVRLRRSVVQHVTVTTAAGLILGGLVGAIVGLRRR